ncbi:peptide chain release factor 2 [Thermosulfurimonas marina]|uniref:Peptide chain release factor 2 n=1 Tax=Thermosulfurimonas marina TaxID=2047767 RepID=A0A6H1WT61_9BACT|nr:peptide chain release factor 2 [Thermosulfurimonas marina]QJA06360.1 peptide chain release factor 2 [Thermosulfurimonas marina]
MKSLILQPAEIRAALERLGDRLADLRGVFDPEALRRDLERIEKEVSRPDFWASTEAQRVLKERARISETLRRWESLSQKFEDLEVLFELALEENSEEALVEVRRGLEELEEELAEEELRVLLSGEHDAANAIVTIHAGAGGTEAQDWVEMLLRMYSRWAERKGYRVRVVDLLAGEEAGLKYVTLLVEGPYAYGHLKAERGVHRLVRISPFDASGRRHTSFASVTVIPEIEEDIQIEIRPEDLRIETMRASGHGGQHVNKTETAVRITHLPTGIVVTCQNERSQHLNKAMAFKILKARLYELERRKLEEKKAQLAGEKKEIAFGHQLRSYILQPYRLVKDHRTGYETGNVEAVLDGEIDPFIRAYLLSQAHGEAGRLSEEGLRETPTSTGEEGPRAEARA